MPEFRRGLARWLPRDAERDLFHPSLEDLRAQHHGRARLRAAIVLLWLDCWRVWLFNSATPPARRGMPNHPHRGGRPVASSRNSFAMLIQDLRRAFRIFRVEPGFAAIAVLTLALGIGANTALFAVVEAVLLRPLPVTGAGEIVILRHRDTNSGITKEFLGTGDVFELKTRVQTMQDLTEYGNAQATMFDGEEPVPLGGLSDTPELFAALQVQPALGRLISAADVRRGASPVVMISHELWQTRFGSDPNIIGRGLQFTSAKRQVIGVLPQGFHFPPNSDTDIAIPMTVAAAPPPQRQGGWVKVLARLKPGQSIQSASAELATLSREFAEKYPGQNRGTQYYAESLRDALVGDTKQPLLLLLAAVGCVLLIACVNVGNLLLARSLGRTQEIAVRTALGAGWMRLVSQIFTEGIVLAIVGGLAGVVLAWQAAPALAALVPESAAVPGLKSVGLNVPVVVFSIGVSLLAALLFSTVSCIGLNNAQRRAALGSTRGTSMSAGARRAASWLVAGEIALAGVLLVGAGLTLRSFANLIAVDPGFRIDHVLTMQITLPAARYRTPETVVDFYARAQRALEDLPEVNHAGTAEVVPLTGNNWTVALDRVDRPAPAGLRPPDVGWQTASAGYFRALEIPLKAGRLFEDRDRLEKVTPVIISQAIADQFFPNEDPIGMRLKAGSPDGSVIVGVVGNIRRASLTDSPRTDMYFPGPANTLFLQTSGDPLSALPAVRTALRTHEPSVVIGGARTMSDYAAASMAITSLAMRLLAGFAIVAVLLAAIGIYGVMAYSVRRRSREIGTRVALGAARGDIIAMVMREGGVITAIGVGAGLGAGLFAARSLSAILYGVPPADPIALAAAAAVLFGTGLAASYAPARRAARIDPARTLTAE
jgi:putative ABC transport system permease protein